MMKCERAAEHEDEYLVQSLARRRLTDGIRSSLGYGRSIINLCNGEYIYIIPPSIGNMYGDFCALLSSFLHETSIWNININLVM